MGKILQQEDSRLRQPAQSVSQAEFGSLELKNILALMSGALAAEADGVALAAPQVGIGKRIFIVSKRLLPNRTNRDLIFINPIITQTSKKKIVSEEGCLSTRWLYGKTSRAEKVTVAAVDEWGKKFTRHGSGVWAQVFQHEIDHLDGILFTDHATDVKEIKPEK